MNQASTTPAPASPAQPVGMGVVLGHVRRPEEAKRPHVVEFKKVSNRPEVQETRDKIAAQLARETK